MDKTIYSGDFEYCLNFNRWHRASGCIYEQRR